MKGHFKTYFDGLPIKMMSSVIKKGSEPSRSVVFPRIKMSKNNGLGNLNMASFSTFYLKTTTVDVSSITMVI